MNCKLLRKLRTQKGLTQEQLGELVGVSGAYIQQLEKGKKTNPSLNTLNALADALGSSSGELSESDTSQIFMGDSGSFILPHSSDRISQLEPLLQVLGYTLTCTTNTQGLIINISKDGQSWSIPKSNFESLVPVILGKLDQEVEHSLRLIQAQIDFLTPIE